MSEEAEDAAKCRMLGKYKVLTQDLAVFRNEMSEVAKSLESLGRFLSDPSWKFSDDGDYILAEQNDIAGVRPARVLKANLDPEHLLALVNEINHLEGSRKNLQENLKDAGAFGF